VSDLHYLKDWLRSTTSSGSTERERRELIDEFDQFFAYLFNSSKDGISVLDTELTILGVNNAMKRWYQFDRPLVGEKCYAIYHNRSTPCDKCPSLTALRTGRPHVGVVPYEGDSGARGTQELSVFPLYDNNKRIFGLLEYVRDITEIAEEERIVGNLKRRIQFQEQTMREQEIALDVMLRQGERVERKLAQIVLANVSVLIDPLIERMKNRLAGTDAYIDLELLSKRLKQITSPFIQALTLDEQGLTLREREIASLIREGRTTKDIAKELGITTKTVDYHRTNLRTKLGLTNSNERLHAFLSRIGNYRVSPGK